MHVSLSGLGGASELCCRPPPFLQLIRMRHPVSHLLLLPLLLTCVARVAFSLAPARGYHINCGASEDKTVGNIKWITDDGFVATGNKSRIRTPGLLHVLTTARHFPDKAARKYCYEIPVTRGTKYLVRTTYYYGGFDGGAEPPVFDQIIGGNRWSTVNTSSNYAQGLTSYYEIIVAARRRTMSICLARNRHTASSPFISALQLEYLEDSMYNSTDFAKYGLSTIARHDFGRKDQIISFPDDPFNRYWEPFTDDNPVVEAHSNATPSDFWNFPPVAVLQRALTTSRGQKLVLKWPPMSLPDATYYITLYFQDNRTPSPYSWRVFSVAFNNMTFYSGLNVSTDGTMVYATRWPLSGDTQMVLTPDDGSPVGPVISAGEILLVLPLVGRTHSRDVLAMEELARSLNGIPSDWSGDPCLPKHHSWTGVGCSRGKVARVVSLNLTDYGISGTLPETMGSLTAITEIYLGGNKLTGSIPRELGNLQKLVYLHLNDNQLSGTIPSTLGNLRKIREIHLQNNNLRGEVPGRLRRRSGIDIRISPGNYID